MSVRVMSWVFQESRSRGTDRLVLLSIADSANDAGCEAWPSLSTIAHKAGVDRRTVMRSLARLEEIGELERVKGGGRAGHGGVSNSYRVRMSSPQKQGHVAPRGDVSLGAESPEVGAESHRSGGEVSPDPSRTVLSIRGRGAEPVDKYEGATEAGLTAAKDARAALRPVPDRQNPAGETGAGCVGGGGSSARAIGGAS